MQKAFLSFGLLVSVLLGGFQNASGIESAWNRFRGPQGTGLVAGPSFPTSWELEDYLWQVELPGRGHSSPVIWKDTVYVTGASPETGDVALYAFRIIDGAELWRLNFAADVYPTHQTNTFASCTPTVDDERIYLSLASPRGSLFVAVSHAGKEAWRRNLGSFDSQHGCGVSPIVYQDLVILACDNEGESFVTALECRTGETRWQTDRKSGKASYATPVIWPSPQGASQLIVNSTAEGMTALSLDDGAVLWQLADVFPQRCVSSPLLGGDCVFGGCGGGSNGYNLVCVRPSTEVNSPPEIVYQLKKSVPQVPTPVASEDYLFVVHDRGAVSCRNLVTGDDYWIKRVGARFSASPICVAGRLYCTGEDGTVKVLAADKEYQELGEGHLFGIAYATPAVAGNSMIFRTVSSLQCLAAESL